MSACYATSNSSDELALILAGMVAPDGAVIGDGSAGGGSTQDGGGMGPGGDATVGADSGGVAINPCPAAQEQFGFVAQGDSNSSYTSGVGVRTATQLLVFNGFSGAPVSGVDAGDAGIVNLVDVQAFDRVTATSLGPPAILFQAPDGTGLELEDVSIAPTGQIALAFGYAGGNSGVGQLSNVYAAFLAPSSSDSGGVSLSVGPITQLTSARVDAQPYVIWSSANQAFVFSWENYQSGPDAIRIAQFLPDGRPANGASGVVPTTTAGGVNTNSGAVATAGHLTGVGFESYYLGRIPYLTILDPTNTQVGSSVQLSTTAAQWMAVGGTAQGFVTVFDNGTGGAQEAFVSASADGGAPATATDGGDAGALPGFAVPGAANVVGMRAISDDTGGPGGVGAVLLTSTQVSFVYVNPTGLAPLAGSNLLFGHAYANNDFVAISNYRGLFAVSLYDSTKHSTQVIASGCQ